MQETSESAATHRYKVVSLFSGGGGLDLGFKQAGYDIVWAIDNASDAVETYRKNIGDHIVCADINTISPDGIPQCDIIIGGPPCQSFSLAGNRNAEDARGQLVWTYLEIINAKRPKLFLFENVPGIYNPQIQIFAESETKRPFFKCSFKTKRTKKDLRTTQTIKPEIRAKITLFRVWLCQAQFNRQYNSIQMMFKQPY